MLKVYMLLDHWMWDLLATDLTLAYMISCESLSVQNIHGDIIELKKILWTLSCLDGIEMCFNIHEVFSL